MQDQSDQSECSTNPATETPESPRPALERCPNCREQHDPSDGSCGERILERRRAFMPGYDEAIKEWLS